MRCPVCKKTIFPLTGIRWYIRDNIGETYKTKFHNKCIMNYIMTRGCAERRAFELEHMDTSKSPRERAEEYLHRHGELPDELKPKD